MKTQDINSLANNVIQAIDLKLMRKHYLSAAFHRALDANTPLIRGMVAVLVTDEAPRNTPKVPEWKPTSFVNRVTEEVLKIVERDLLRTVEPKLFTRVERNFRRHYQANRALIQAMIAALVADSSDELVVRMTPRTKPVQAAQNTITVTIHGDTPRTISGTQEDIRQLLEI